MFIFSSSWMLNLRVRSCEYIFFSFFHYLSFTPSWVILGVRGWWSVHLRLIHLGTGEEATVSIVTRFLLCYNLFYTYGKTISMSKVLWKCIFFVIPIHVIHSEQLFWVFPQACLRRRSPILLSKTKKLPVALNLFFFIFVGLRIFIFPLLVILYVGFLFKNTISQFFHLVIDLWIIGLYHGVLFTLFYTLKSLSISIFTFKNWGHILRYEIRVIKH